MVLVSAVIPTRGRPELLRRAVRSALAQTLREIEVVVVIDGEDANLVEINEEVTLMDWGNAIVRKVQKDAATGKVVAIEGELNLQGDFKKTKKKLTWLAK